MMNMIEPVSTVAQTSPQEEHPDFDNCFLSSTPRW